MRKLVHMLPKPVLFGVLGALGCMIGWAVGEPLLSTIKPPATAEDATGDFTEEVSPILVFNNELQKRLKREEAQSGDVQISLMWDNINDLDLHCIDPKGERIFYNHKRARSGGELDVDMNAQEPFSQQPVENIFWPPDGAPEGDFKIFVHHYAIHDAANGTAFTLGIKHGDTLKEIKGTVSNQQMEEIYTFAMVPESERRQTLVEVRSQRPTVALLPTLVLGLWTSLLAIFTSGMLVVGQNFLTRRPLLTKKQLGMVAGGGLIAGLVSGVVSQYLFSFGAAMFEKWVQEMPVLLKLGQVICWGLLGVLMGLGMGFFIPNLARGKAGAAGLVGGVIGAIAFLIAMSIAGELPGRFIGTAVLGFTIGLVVALVERLAREAALIVHWDPNEQTVINLGPEPVVLGSGNDVHLYLPLERGFPEVTALVTFKDGVVQMDNKLSGSVHTLQGGNKLEIGSLIIEIQTDVQS
jgi:hypothetical protein